MRWVTAGVSVAALWGVTFLATAAECHIAADGMAVVDGERIFVVGLYEDPKEDAVLKQAADAGFNLVYSTAKTASLERLLKYDVWAWINTGYAIDLSQSRSQREGQLRQMVQDFAGHPALMVWEVPDEALWNCWYRAVQWRWHREPGELSERIRALEDKDRAKALQKELTRANALRAAGDYAASEQAADALWKELDVESPQPGLNYSDAAERAAKMAIGMAEGYAQLRQLDPNHPIWMNHAPRNQIEQLAVFNKGADAVGCDIYPVPKSRHNGHSDVADQTVSSVGVYTDRMQAAAPGKPVWMVLQGFGWADIREGIDEEMVKVLRRPTLKETRFMAYDAIVHGARGILYWGTAYIEKDSRLWEDLLTLAQELKELQPVLAAPDAAIDLDVRFEETNGSVDRGVRILPKAVDGKVWLLAVNEWTSPLDCTIDGLGVEDGATYVVGAAKKEITVQQGVLRIMLAPQAAVVLEPK